MPSPEQQGIYADYFGHQASDKLGVMRLYEDEGRYSSREMRFIFGALQKSAQMLGAIIVARDSGQRESVNNDRTRPFRDPIVGVIRHESGNPLMGEVSGLVVAQNRRGLHVPELIVPPVEREIYEQGFSEAELFVEADDPDADIEAWRRNYWREHHGYQDSITSKWLRKPLLDADGNCIHPPNDFEVPHEKIDIAFRLIRDRLGVKQFQTELHLHFSNDSIRNFNLALEEIDDELINNLSLTYNQRPKPTPWHHVYSQYNQRAGDSDFEPVRRWTRIKARDPYRYDVLYLQEYQWTGHYNDLSEPDKSRVSTGYMVARRLVHANTLDYDFKAVHYDGSEVRECNQTETNYVMKALDHSAYTFSHDPESVILHPLGVFKPHPTLWQP